MPETTDKDKNWVTEFTESVETAVVETVERVETALQRELDHVSRGELLDTARRVGTILTNPAALPEMVIAAVTEGDRPGDIPQGIGRGDEWQEERDRLREESWNPRNRRDAGTGGHRLQYDVYQVLDRALNGHDAGQLDLTNPDVKAAYDRLKAGGWEIVQSKPGSPADLAGWDYVLVNDKGQYLPVDVTRGDKKGGWRSILLEIQGEPFDPRTGTVKPDSAHIPGELIRDLDSIIERNKKNLMDLGDANARPLSLKDPPASQGQLLQELKDGYEGLRKVPNVNPELLRRLEVSIQHRNEMALREVNLRTNLEERMKPAIEQYLAEKKAGKLPPPTPWKDLSVGPDTLRLDSQGKLTLEHSRMDDRGNTVVDKFDGQDLRSMIEKAVPDQATRDAVMLDMRTNPRAAARLLDLFRGKLGEARDLLASPQSAFTHSLKAEDIAKIGLPTDQQLEESLAKRLESMRKDSKNSVIELKDKLDKAQSPNERQKAREALEKALTETTRASMPPELAKSAFGERLRVELTDVKPGEATLTIRSGTKEYTPADFSSPRVQNKGGEQFLRMKDGNLVPVKSMEVVMKAPRDASLSELNERLQVESVRLEQERTFEGRQRAGHGIKTGDQIAADAKAIEEVRERVRAGSEKVQMEALTKTAAETLHFLGLNKIEGNASELAGVHLAVGEAIEEFRDVVSPEVIKKYKEQIAQFDAETKLAEGQKRPVTESLNAALTRHDAKVQDLARASHEVIQPAKPAPSTPSEHKRPTRGPAPTIDGLTGTKTSTNTDGTMRREGTVVGKPSGRPDDRAPESLSEKEMAAMKERKEELEQKKDRNQIEDAELRALRDFEKRAHDPATQREVAERVYRGRNARGVSEVVGSLTGIAILSSSVLSWWLAEQRTANQARLERAQVH